MTARKPSEATDHLDDFPWLDFGHAVVNFETGQIVNMRDEGDDDGEDSATPAGGEAARRGP